MRAELIPLAFALTSVPAFLVARSLERSHRRRVAAGEPRVDASGRLARLMNWVGFVLLAGAAGLFWAGTDTTRMLAVASLMALGVNGLAVAMLLAVIRSHRGGRPR